MILNKNWILLGLSFFLLQTGCTSTAKKAQSNSETIKITAKEEPVKVEPYAQTRAEKIISDADFGKITDTQATEAFLLAKEFEKNNDLPMAEKLYQVCFKRTPTLNVGLALIQVKMGLRSIKEAKQIANYLSAAYPKQPEPLIVLIHISRAENNPQETKQILERAYQNFSSHERIVVLYAEYHKDQTEKILENFIQTHTASSYILLVLSEYLAQKNQTQKALKYAKMAYEHDPNNLNVTLFVGQLEYSLKNNAEAEKYFQQAYDKDSDNPMITQNYLSILLQQKKFSDALRVLHKMESDADANTPFSPEMRLQLVRVLLLNQNYQEALKQLNLLLEARFDANVVYYHMGACYEGTKEYEKAIAQYEKVAEQSTPYPQAAKARIILYLQTQQNDKAKQRTQELPITFENEEEDALFRATIAAYFADYKEAIAILDKAIELHPKVKKLRLSRADYLVALSPEKAFKEAQKIIETWPQEADGFNFFGYTLLNHSKDYNKAKTLLQKANQLDPENPYYADSLGWYYYKTNDLKHAQALLEKSNRLSGGEEPVILYHYAQVLLKLGHKQEALNQLEKTQKAISNMLTYFLSLDSELKSIAERIDAEVKDVQKSLTKKSMAS